jgi:hypothetical protein
MCWLASLSIVLCCAGRALREWHRVAKPGGRMAAAGAACPTCRSCLLPLQCSNSCVASPPENQNNRSPHTCTVWAPAGERTQMILIMRGLAMKLATGVQAGTVAVILPLTLCLHVLLRLSDSVSRYSGLTSQL